MKAFTLRVRTKTEEAALDTLQLHTGEATRSKATWRAIFDYPRVRAQLKTTESRLAQCEAHLREIQMASQRLDRAQQDFESVLDPDANPLILR